MPGLKFESLSHKQDGAPEDLKKVDKLPALPSSPPHLPVSPPPLVQVHFFKEIFLIPDWDSAIIKTFPYIS